MTWNTEHLKHVLLAKGYTHDARLDIWVNPQGEWFHLYPDGHLGRLSPKPLNEYDPVPQQPASL